MDENQKKETPFLFESNPIPMEGREIWEYPDLNSAQLI